MRSRRLTKAVLSKTAILLFSGFLGSIAHAGSWNDHATKLSNLTKQIQAKEEEIRELIEAKKKTTDHKKLAEIVKTLGDLHVKLEELSAQYEKERQHVRFEHPDRNEDLERVYVRHRVLSISEMESEFGLDGRLDRLKVRVLKTFPIAEEKEKTKEKKDLVREPASQPQDEDAPEKIHLRR